MTVSIEVLQPISPKLCTMVPTPGERVGPVSLQIGH